MTTAAATAVCHIEAMRSKRCTHLCEGMRLNICTTKRYKFNTRTYAKHVHTNSGQRTHQRSRKHRSARSIDAKIQMSSTIKECHFYDYLESFQAEKKTVHTATHTYMNMVNVYLHRWGFDAAVPIIIPAICHSISIIIMILKETNQSNI